MISTRTPAAYPLGDEHDRERVPVRGPARVGVRELRQNLSVYLRRIEAGETLEVTEHGRPVARLTPLPPRSMSVLDRLVAEGKAVPGRGGNVADLGLPPAIGPGLKLSDVLAAIRDEEER
jgi:prevent-host-death family protein